MSYDNLSSVSQNVLKFYQQLTGEERRIPFIFDDFHFCRSRVIKSPKQSLGDLLFLLRFLYYYYSYSYSSFFPCTMNLSTADLRNYRTEFHETWWSYRYMFLVDPKVFRFVVKGVKAIFLGVQRGWGLL